MTYLLHGKKYSFSYKDLRDHYDSFCKLSDREFIYQLPNIIHFACFVGYLKELSATDTISDEGIVHKLVHLLCISEPLNDLQEIREQFKQLLIIQ